MSSAYRQSDAPAPIETPCIDVCVIEQATGLCTGCMRSLAEIAAWGTLSFDDRRSIMSELPTRRGNGAKKAGAE